MGKPELLYRDEYGNTLWQRKLKRHKGMGVQMYAKNAQGKIVTQGDLVDIARRAGWHLQKLPKPISVSQASRHKYSLY